MHSLTSITSGILTVSSGSQGREAYILTETDFRSAAFNEEISSIRLLEDLTFQEPFLFLDHPLRLEGEQVTCEHLGNRGLR